MKEMNLLKEKYDKIVKETLNLNLPILIDSFVEFYGEKHRTLIENRIKNTEFVYYADFELILTILRDGTNENLDDELYIDMLLYVNNYIEIFTNKFNRLKRLLTRYEFLDMVIGTTKKELLKIKETKEIINYSISCYDVLAMEYMDYYENRIVLLPLFILTTDTIIHELNHVVSDSRIAKIEDSTLFTEVNKVGVSESLDDDKTYLNELITEKIAIKITEIFIEKGGDFNNIIYPIKDGYITEDYKEDLYLINDFYNTFEDLIKEAFIGDDLNLLTRKVGKNNYNDLFRLLSDYIQFCNVKNEEERKHYLDKAKEIVTAMKEYYNNVYDLTESDYNNYYEELEKSGRKVKVLKQ